MTCLMYEVFFKFCSCNEDIKPSAAFSWRHQAFSCLLLKTSSLQLPSLAGRHIKYNIHAPACTKTRHFYLKNSKKILGKGHSPLSRPLPQREGDTSFRTHRPRRLQRLDLRAFGAHSRTPTRNSGYGPASCCRKKSNTLIVGPKVTQTRWKIC